MSAKRAFRLANFSASTTEVLVRFVCAAPMLTFPVVEIGGALLMSAKRAALAVLFSASAGSKAEEGAVVVLAAELAAAAPKLNLVARAFRMLLSSPPAGGFVVFITV